MVLLLRTNALGVGACKACVANSRNFLTSGGCMQLCQDPEKKYTWNVDINISNTTVNDAALCSACITRVSSDTSKNSNASIYPCQAWWVMDRQCGFVGFVKTTIVGIVGFVLITLFQSFQSFDL